MASRTKRFAHGLISGYGAIVFNVLYTILSVRLALYYLGKEQFGLWALALQIAGYMALLDLGMSSAISRFLADHKDDVNEGEYGALLLTGGLSFTCQGILISLAGLCFSLIAPFLFHIPRALASDFRVVLVIITMVYGFSIAARSIGAPLWAFQRMDVSNLVSTMTLITSYFTLWLGFKAGWGIYSLAYAGVPSAVLSPIILFFICYGNGYYPARGCWGAPRWDLFYKVFGFGKDVLLMSLGSQLVNATQIMILSRVAGLDAAATFSIGTKFYTMGQQFVAKILESSAPALTDMYVRGDFQRFKKRFWNVVSLTTIFSVIAATFLITCNQRVIFLWTSGSIHWTLWADLLLALLLIASSLSKCFVGFFGLIGNLISVRYLYVLIAIPSAYKIGVYGVLLASLIAHITTTLFISKQTCCNWFDSKL